MSGLENILMAHDPSGRRPCSDCSPNQNTLIYFVRDLNPD